MMSLQKTFYQRTFYRVCSAGLFLLVGCHRDVPMPLLETDDVRNIVFKLSGFESKITPLSARDIKEMMGLADVGMQALHNIVPGPELQYLYYWSFNEKSLEPDIAVDEESVGVESDVDLKFGSGFSLDPYEAGDALSITGAETVEITLPVKGISSFADFSFDMSSSNTGPKDFLLSYSIDGGSSYEVLADNNQFDKMGAQARNGYSFDISIFPQFIGIEVLKLKVDFLPGNREGAGDYNESTGVVRLDNIRLSGIYNGAPEAETSLSMPSTLRYYVFSSDDGRVIAQEELPLNELTEDGLLKIKIPQGTYDILFLAYRSEGSLLLPENLANAKEFYFGQDFDDYQAVTYASLKRNFEVGSSNVAESAILTRCFSLVAFDFTDLWPDLREVKKIDITRQHEDYLYTPYGEPIELPMSDRHTLTFDKLATEENYQLTFHQFLGMSDDVQNVSYELTAYGIDEEKLNTVSVSADIQNNMQLRFRGRLLGNLDRFSLEIHSDWEETVERDF